MLIAIDLTERQIQTLSCCKETFHEIN